MGRQPVSRMLIHKLGHSNSKTFRATTVDRSGKSVAPVWPRIFIAWRSEPEVGQHEQASGFEGKASSADDIVRNVVSARDCQVGNGALGSSAIKTRGSVRHKWNECHMLGMSDTVGLLPIYQ